MEQNIGTADRYFRLAAGMISMASLTSRRRQSTLTKTVLLSFGAMKIAEGVTGWCPMQYVTQMINSGKSGTMTQNKGSSEAPNPSGQKNTSENQKNDGQMNAKNTPDFVSLLMDQDDQPAKPN